MVLKLDLHYTHTDSNLRHTENQHVDIGKPLVASCKLYKGTQSNKRQDSTSAQSMGNMSSSASQRHQTPARPCHTRKAVYDVKTATVRSNEPEENDENEL